MFRRTNSHFQEIRAADAMRRLRELVDNLEDELDRYETETEEATRAANNNTRSDPS